MMSLGNREGWRSNEAEPEELPEYQHTMPAKDSQRKRTLFCHGQKGVFALFRCKTGIKNKRHKLFIFTVKIKRGEANEKKFTD